ncbi:MAG: hypothetical protein NTZ16_11295 [Verrucomicrobia bacterium]|nr:hypothetical protein [Verrucomicrobiota bacterium]
MALVAFIVFWGSAIRLWVEDGAKIPLIFIALWFAALFSFPHLGFNRFAFLAFEATLAAVLLIITQYKSSL